MSLFKFALLIAVSCTVYGILTINIADARVYQATPGTRVPGVATTVTGLRSAIHCCLRCNRHDACAAVNFNKATKTCELLQRSTTLLPTESSFDWTLYQDLQSQDVQRTNPMLNATATQSSTGYSGYATNAIDGDTNSDYYASSCSSTSDTDPSPWWQLQFGETYSIKGVIIWNRLDDARAYRLRYLTIYISSTVEDLGDSTSVCGSFPGPPDPLSTNPVTVTCSQEMTGRYLRIHKDFAEYLTLCEVEIVLA